MITLGQPQHLGQRTFMLFISRRVTLGVVAFLISGVLAFIGPSLAVGIGSAASLGGSASRATVATIGGYISSFTILLFLVSVILVLVGIIIALVQYRNYIFVLNEFSLKMKHGLLNQLEISIPYRQIQDINLVRTFPHRM